MQLDTHTALFVSASILTAVGSAVLFFSSIKKENRFFIWAAIAAFGFAGTLYLMYFRGRISDFFSIVVANELGVICLTSFFESFRYLINVRSMERFAGPLLLVIQPMFISWYTYYEPNFSARIFIASITFCIMCFCIAKLLLTNMMKNQASLRILTSIPFIFMFIFSIIRIFIFIFGKEFPENSLESSAFAMSTAIYGIIAVWTILCLVFMVSNSLQNQVAEMALADPLTGTLNRRALRDTAEREIARSKRNATPLSLIIADLDHFKKVNDIYGHQAGDAILIHVVAQYKKILRSEDVLARYGGEEFVVLLPGADVSMAVSIAERLRKICKAKTLIYNDKPIPITSSFGVSGITNEIVEYEAVIKQADEALYTAKEKGRDQVVVFNG